jgi:butyrate kinase
MIQDRVTFIAPVTVFPGELEMEALANGALRILKGIEAVQIF